MNFEKLFLILFFWFLLVVLPFVLYFLFFFKYYFIIFLPANFTPFYISLSFFIPFQFNSDQSKTIIGTETIHCLKTVNSGGCISIILQFLFFFISYELIFLWVYYPVYIIKCVD
jgi:hypothetical protein